MQRDDLLKELAKVTAERDEAEKIFQEANWELLLAQSATGKVEEERNALRARNAELESALRPFADAAPLIEHARGTFGIWARCSTIPGDSYTITVQHIRDAAAAITRHKL